MYEQDLSERPYRGLRPFCRMIAAASEGARLIELEGVVATVVPVTPDRSITNSVVYEHPEALEQALDLLAETYADAGIRAWTVWVPGHDREAARMLEESGHRLDAAPSAMALELDGFEGSPRPDLVLDTEPEAVEVGRINDAAYGMDGDFSRAFARRPAELRLYAARHDGRAVACVGALHEDGDCGIYLVATHPDAQGRGLASDLMAVALVEGRRDGCATASL